MTEFLQLLENTPISRFVASDSVLGFPTVLLLHTYGMAAMVGVLIAVDLRILGFAPGLPLGPLKRFFPIVWAAFWLNAVTGTMLLMADATSKATNPDFLIKMACVALGVINMRLIQRRVFREPEVSQGVLPASARVLAVTSLILWFGAITSGRLLAYITPASTGLK